MDHTVLQMHLELGLVLKNLLNTCCIHNRILCIVAFNASSIVAPFNCHVPQGFLSSFTCWILQQ